MSRGFLILLAVAWVLVGVVSGLLVLFVPLLFDAPGSERNLATIALAVGVVSCPAACLTALYVTWPVIRSGGGSPGWMWVLLPIASIVVGGLGMLWILVVQGGQFAG